LSGERTQQIPLAVEQARQRLRAQRAGEEIRDAPLGIGNAGRPAARVRQRSDQDQAIEIPSFLPRRTGDNRPDQAVGNDFHGRQCLGVTR